MPHANSKNNTPTCPYCNTSNNAVRKIKFQHHEQRTIYKCKNCGNEYTKHEANNL